MIMLESLMTMVIMVNIMANHMTMKEHHDYNS